MSAELPDWRAGSLGWCFCLMKGFVLVLVNHLKPHKITMKKSVMTM